MGLLCVYIIGIPKKLDLYLKISSFTSSVFSNFAQPSESFTQFLALHLNNPTQPFAIFTQFSIILCNFHSVSIFIPQLSWCLNALVSEINSHFLTKIDRCPKPQELWSAERSEAEEGVL